MSQKSFILHKDSLSILDQLTDDQAGKLFKAIYSYQKTGEILDIDQLIKIAINPFLNQFERDKEKYTNIVERNKNNGSKGGRPTNPNNPKKPTGLFGNPKKPRKADSDSKNDSDNDNKNNKKEESENFQIFWNKYDYKKSRSKALASFKTALKKESFENIIAGLENYIKNRGTDPKFWKHPTTWLNSESWSDEYKTKKDNHNNFNKQDYTKGTEGFNVY